MARFRLSRAAQEDIASILTVTTQSFGDDARIRYQRLLIAALRDIASDPNRHGIKARPEFGEGVRSYHIRHSRGNVQYKGIAVRRPRHLILFREIETDLMGIGRILYDAMEAEQHLSDDYAQE
jgi:toxin ParE1/3/4